MLPPFFLDIAVRPRFSKCMSGDIPGSLVVRTLCFHYRGCGFDSLLTPSPSPFSTYISIKPFNSFFFSLGKRQCSSIGLAKPCCLWLLLTFPAHLARHSLPLSPYLFPCDSYLPGLSHHRAAEHNVSSTWTSHLSPLRVVNSFSASGISAQALFAQGRRLGLH